jgi:hypothetical protein
MHAAAILKLLRGHGCTVTTDGEHLSVRKGKEVLTDALRHAIASEKGAIMTILAAEYVRASMPLRSDAIAAVKVWSEVLEEAIWVVAEGLPLDEYLGDGVYRHGEIRVLIEQGRGVKVWAPLDPGMER